MAKPILDVQIDDEKFKAFSELHAKYLANLQKMPGAWAGVDKSTKTSFEAVAAAMMAQNELARREAKALKDLTNAGKGAGGAWSTVAAKSRETLGNVKNITLSLLRWASLGTVFTGLLGGGGLFGLDRLAGNVGANRRAALGLGVSYGERKAFDVNYGRVVDSEGYLSNVNSALHDASLRGKLYGAGLGENQLKGSTADVSVRLLQQIKVIADRTPAALLQQTMSARGLDQFITLQEFERIKATPKGELAGYAGAFGRDKNSFGLDAKSQLAWQNFSVQMNRAGQKIENVFVAGLGKAHIPEALDKLSDAFAKSVETFMSSKQFGEWLKLAGEDIKWVAEGLGNGSIQAKILSFANNIGLAAEGTVRALRWLGLIPQSQEEAAAKKKKADDYKAGAGARTAAADADMAKDPIAGTLMKWLGYKGSDKTLSVDALLPAIAKAESANGKYNLSPKGARGMYQIMPDTAAAYGKNPDDPKQAREMARSEVLRMVKYYAGDLEKILSGYNWGQGNTDKAIAKYGSDWKAHAPAETKAYIIKIENNTGGNAVVTASQLPQ